MGRVFKPAPRVIRGKKVTYTSWYVEYQGADGKTHRRAVGPRHLAVQALARAEDAEARKRAGLPPAADGVAAPPSAVAGLIGEYLRELAARDTSPDYRASAGERLARMAEGCGWRTLADLSAGRLTVFLGLLRDTPAVRRKGGERRGCAPATLNGYLRTAKAFAGWAADRFGTPHPFARMKPYPEEVDRRRSKRILTDEEFGKLLAAARGAPRRATTVVDGPARAVLYAVAAYTGLRAGELAALTPGHFDLAARPPVVTVGARDAKGKREEPVPLPGHLADELREWFRGRPRDGLLWPGSWAAQKRQVHWLARDLKRAGVAAADGRGRGVTFHSLKRRFVVRLIEAGAKVHEVRRMARHKNVATTLNYYTDTDLGALGELADRLPRAAV